MPDFSQHKLMTLPFAVATPNRVDIWPAACGDIFRLGREGRERATQVIDYMLSNDSPLVLSHVMRAIANQGQWGELETAFCHQLAASLIGATPGRNAADSTPTLRLIVDNDYR